MKLGHIGIPVKDIDKSKQFYDAVVEYVGLELISRGEVGNVRYGENGSTRLYVHTRNEGVKNVHLCFDVDSKEAVGSFYEAAIAAGGTDNGAPGVRPDYSPTYYAAFVFDPDGNNIEMVFRG